MHTCDNLQYSIATKFLQVGDVPLGTTCFKVNAVHTFLLHAFLSLPGPPYFFLSLQCLHKPQSSFLHPSHLPHLLRTYLFPTYNITVSCYISYYVLTPVYAEMVLYTCIHIAIRTYVCTSDHAYVRNILHTSSTIFV